MKDEVACSCCKKLIKPDDLVFILKGHTFICCSLGCLINVYGINVRTMKLKDFAHKCHKYKEMIKEYDKSN